VLLQKLLQPRGQLAFPDDGQVEDVPALLEFH
jgi:hypothetical protein